jgi:GNAT superfamily N-acetyltransferase
MGIRMWRVEKFLPEKASPEDWRQYHAYRRQAQAEWRPKEPPAPDDVAQAKLLMPRTQRIERMWRVMVGDEMVGILETGGPSRKSPEYPTNKHLIDAEGYVLKAHRRRGIGRAYLPLVVEMMDERGATVLGAGAEDEPGHAFLRWLGAAPRYTERQSRLELAGLDWAMVARWVDDGRARNPDSRFELYPNRVPEELWAEYHAASTELLNTMPWEDLDHGDIVVSDDSTREWYQRLDVSGSYLHTCLVRDPDGSIVAMTDMMYHPYEQGLLRQMFTGVRPSARGRGLGKWVKAAMLQHVHRTHPGITAVTTENAGSNDAMLGINHALGFRVERVGTWYQVDRATLARAI